MNGERAAGTKTTASSAMRLARVLGRPQVAEVDGVERPAEHAEPHAGVSSGPDVSGRGTRTCSQSAWRSASSPAPVTAEMGSTRRPSSAAARSQRGQRVGLLRGVALGGGHQLRLREQLRVPEARFLPHRVQVRHRVAPRGARGVDHVQQHARALDVPQELQAETGARVRALDDPGDVGHHEAVVRADRHHAQHRRERREGVVRDLRPRRGQRGQQGRLAGVREAEQAHVRHAAAGRAAASAPRPRLPARASRGRAVPVRQEGAVAAAAAAAARDPQPVALRGPPRPAPRPCSASAAMVPGGTWISRSVPFAARAVAGTAVLAARRPGTRCGSAGEAACSGGRRRADGRRRRGRPLRRRARHAGTYGSRRKLTQPRPPSPPFTNILTRSTNIAPAGTLHVRVRRTDVARSREAGPPLLRLGGDDADAEPARAVVLEADHTVGRARTACGPCRDPRSCPGATWCRAGGR